MKIFAATKRKLRVEKGKIQLLNPWVVLAANMSRQSDVSQCQYQSMKVDQSAPEHAKYVSLPSSQSSILSLPLLNPIDSMKADEICSCEVSFEDEKVLVAQ